MPGLDSVTLCREYLFVNADQFRDKVSPAEFDKIIRCRAMYLWMLEMPHSKDSEFVAECCNRFKVARPTAYADLSTLKTIIPDLSRTAKEFHRWRACEMILDTYKTAKLKGDTRTMEKATSDYVKLFHADEDKIDIDLNEIIPQPFIPTMDPSVLGIEPIPNLRERKNALIAKYSKDIEEIKDIDYEEFDLPDVSDIKLEDKIKGEGS